MAKIPEEYNFGNSPEKLTIQELILRLQDMYRDIAIELNKKPDVYQRNSDGLVTDTSLSNGSLNINTTTSKVEMLTQHPTTTTVLWKTLT
jgi:hypothetical protein